MAGQQGLPCPPAGPWYDLGLDTGYPASSLVFKSSSLTFLQWFSLKNISTNSLTFLPSRAVTFLPGVAEWIEHQPANRKVSA